jgi:hypothetical protein
MSNPFEAAISQLEDALKFCVTAEVGDPQEVFKNYWHGMAEKYRSAIRVLEAAGKVDKEGLAFFLRQRNLLMPSSVRVLLSALPDEVKE